MARLIAILLTVACAVPAFAQDARIFIVRDDDGTADEGRGQVSSQNSVCRKTLILDRDPGDLQRAWVQYFMKVNPYDVETKKLYGEPAEGVTWSNLVITVNGTEILREPLIEVGTMGWHEAGFDPALLRRGENQVTITLSEPGNYFYLGIDRDNDYGRSASSRDGGKTWRQSWLSFTTEEADGGEYMVRLKYEAPEPEQVGFIERDGRYSGWLEMEDLFSATEAHASGFKAIEWNRGANRPSGDMVAYNAQGRVSFPLAIPVDRDWKLWMRAWADGFRNGSFTLNVDGRPFYDSSGHEFTSDANLRLDWLEMGVLHLGEGAHTFEIVTEGECGHFFDVFVLTTDMGYVPDESDPLPRMTVESLVAAPGVSRPEPGLYMTPNPIAWARPLAGGPLRSLWVCGDINQREIVELRQRIELEADAISSHISYLGNSIFGQELSLDQADAVYDRLVSERPLDLIVLVRTKLDQLPEHVMSALLSRVEQGAGLIVVRSRRDEQQTALGALLEEMEPLETSPAAPISLSPLDRATIREHGAGRIISVPYSLWGTLTRLDPPGYTLRFPYWEYQFAAWIELLMAAAGRDTAQVATVSVPERVAPDERPTVTVTLAGEAAQARATWLPPFGKPTALDPVPVAGGTASIALPPSAEDGLHHVALTLTDGGGGALGIASAFYEVRHSTRVAEVVAECTDDGSAVVATITIEGEGRLPVRAEVYGSHARLLGAIDATAGGADELRVPLIDSHERLVELRLTVPGDAGPAQRVYTLVPRSQPVVLDDYLPYSGVWENAELPEYAASAYLRVWEDIGIRAIQPSGIVWSSLDQGFATAHPYRLTSAGNGTVDADGVRTPCLHDPEVPAREEPSIRETVRRLRAFSPILLGLGDEQSIGRAEACFSEHTRAAFREWLRGRYASLDELNASWRTDFAAWDAIEPWRLAQAKQRPENIAPWLEFRSFMAHTFVESTRTMQSWAQEEAGDTHIGGVNPWDEGWTTCTVMSKLFPVLEYGQIYPRSHDRARSWFRDPRLIGTWSGYSRPRAQVEREGWLLPTYGGAFMGWYGIGRQLGYGTLTNTIDLGERAQWVSRVNHELNSGVGKLLIESEGVQEPVAILHSWPSRCAYIAAMGAQEPDTPADALDQRWDECEETFVRLLKALKIPYVFVDEDQIAEGYLQEREVDVLIAPRAWALSDEALEAVREFIAEGRPVITDSGLGMYDERGRKRDAAPVTAALNLNETWDDLPAPLSEETIGRLRERLERAHITPFADTIVGNVSFLVHRLFGDAQVGVFFGSGELTLTGLDGAGLIYDVREHRALGHVTEATAQMEHGPAVLVFSREEIAGLGIDTTGAALGEAVRYDLTLASGNDTVARVTVIGPDGEERPWYAENLRIADGAASGNFTPALNDPTGTWTIRALDVITGETAEAMVEVR